MTSVMWFRKDLRIEDNLALANACQTEDELILFFQLNPAQFIPGSPNHQAFFASVAYFKQRIDREFHLHVHFGDPLESFQALKQTVPTFDKVYFNLDESGYGAQRDAKMVHFFSEAGIQVHTFLDGYLHSAHQIKRNQTDFYKVFTPYYKKWLDTPKQTPVYVSWNHAATVITSPLFIEEEHAFTDFCSEFLPLFEQPVGEKEALNRLEAFVSTDLADYQTTRDFPSLDRTSRLSRFLRTGELSIRTVWQAVEQAPDSIGKSTFQKELAWRDFYHMIDVAFPTQKEQAILEGYRYIEWENRRTYFQQWQAGKTGYPIVDAAMRQLKETGWMHNRLRMITASFLTKDLLIDWRWGEKYFQQMLIDYDRASNIGGWQWAASTGTDAVPYFRIFNPTTQSQKFDSDGDFIRNYVPELAQVPKPFIHQPEKMTLEQQKRYGVQIGDDYPLPIVDHQERRKMALARYEFSKEWAKELNK